MVSAAQSTITPNAVPAPVPTTVTYQTAPTSGSVFVLPSGFQPR